MPEENEKDIAEEIADIVRENIPEVVFPDVQKVEIQNLPEQPEAKAPVVNVEAPVVNVPAPVVNVEAPEVTVEKPDLSELAEGLKDLSNKFSEFAEKEIPQFDYDRFEKISKDSKSTYKGGGVISFPITKAFEERDNKISSTNYNSRDAATLAAAATFQGVGEDVSKYGRVGVSFKSDNATDGTLTMETSHDNVTWGGPTRTIANTSIAQPHMWNIVEKYFRIKYVNGTTEATNLSIQVQYSNNADTKLAHQLDATLIDETEATVSRAVSVGQDESNVYRNVGVVNSSGKTAQYVAMGYSNTFTVHMDVSTDSTLIAYSLIDISDTTNWPHTNTSEIVIEYIIIEVDPDTNFAGEVKLGFLTNVDGTNGDFNQILDIDMRRKADLFAETIDFGSHGFHCKAASHFGPITANSTLFQTDVNLGGPDDPTTTAYPSGDGDLVMIVDGDGTNFVNVSTTIGYETVA
jgi:hypothetical protein